MFTGLIEATASVLERADGHLKVERPKDFRDTKAGSSIAVSGVCLTVTALDEKTMAFQMVEETLKRSKLGSVHVGDRVNLERAMKDDGRFEGHAVQGHSEGVGRVLSVVAQNASIPRPLPPEEEGEFIRKYPLNRMIKAFARAMRKKPTHAEKILWEAIRYDQLGVRFRRQYPMGGRILDFYCPKLHLAIEVDGSIHQENFQIKEDVLRDEYLKEDLHVTTLRVTNDAVFEDLEKVLQTIQKTIKQFPSSLGGGARGGGVREGLGVGAVGESFGEGKGGARPVRRPPAGRAGSFSEDGGGGVMLTIELSASLAPYVIPKGSIALDGVSLTVATIEGNLCTVALIPHTLAATTLGSLAEGDGVNIETDVMVRALARLSGKAIA